jgi:hypothetical protein
MLTADRATRTLTADPLLPFGEQGRTNLGRVTAARGTLTIPTDVTGMVLNLQHERNAPLARFIDVAETDHGLVAHFHVPATRAGDDLLAEVENGLRTGVSVEIDNPVIRGGRLLSGTLTGAAAVVDPAFDSARLVAADAGDLDPEQAAALTPDLVQAVVAAVTEAISDKTTEDEQPSDDTDDESEEEATVAEDETVETVEDDKLKAGLPGSLHKAGPKGKASQPPLFAALAGADPAGREAIKVRLNAALDQAIATDLAPTMVKQWLGEVGPKVTYSPRVVDLLSHDDLVGREAVGWKFTEGKTPQVDTYGGFPAQPNSNEVKTEQVTLPSARLAGAGEVDRAWIDFPVPEFWSAYYRECANDYKRKLDAIALAAIVGGSTAVEAGTVATGVSTAAAYIVDGAMAVILAERNLPTFALVGADLYRDLLLTRAQDLIAFLTGALGLEEGDLAGFTIRPSGAASLTGKVLVGARPAATVYELPGASPVRIDTVNIANGGITTGVFGYHAELINDPASLALVAPAVGG